MSRQRPKLALCSLICAAVLLFHGGAAQPPPYSCDQSDPSTKSYIFCKTSLPIRERARDLVSRLTLDEKISQLVDAAPAIPRLSIPEYQWWSEALHGVANVGRGIRFNGAIRSATSFPQVILTAASFDANLWYRIGQVVGTEARAVYNAGQATGMTFWAPNINVFRDPRWGRGQETPGEDPLVAGRYAVAFVRGVQGDSFGGGRRRRRSGDGGHLKASACCKHLTAYDLDEWNASDRYKFDALVTAQDLADTYQPPFKRCVEEGRASGLMCAYNRVNGVPSCANYTLLSTTARGRWGFQGYITSDCDAVSIIYQPQGYAKTPEDAVADVLNAGMDVNCGSHLKNYTKSAVQRKKVSEFQIDRALVNLFSVRMRLGLFDGNPKLLPFGSIGPNQVCSQQHQKLALKAARSGIVLLKNPERLLPLPKDKPFSLAVIGPNANSVKTLQGNYAGPPCKYVTPLEALHSYVKDIKYHSGCDFVKCSSASIDQAVKIAEDVDQVVLIMGLDQSQERESHDRLDLVLPGKQQTLIESVAKAAKIPVVLVLLSGGPLDISFAKDNPKIGGILWAGYPGEAGGIALAEIIFGDQNPGGKLPVTWYPQEFIKVPMTDMRMRPDASSAYPGRTYRFYEGKKVFEFGYGLSYTNYSYKFMSVPKSTLYLDESSPSRPVEDLNSQSRKKLVSELKGSVCKKKLPVSIEVKNEGQMAGKHPVMLFVGQKQHKIGNPLRQLAAFRTVSLEAGEKAEIKFKFNLCEHLSRATENGLMVMEEGSYFLAVGDKEHPITIVL